MSGEQRTRRRRAILTWTLIGILTLAVAVPSIRLAYPLLPSYAQTSCTATSPSERHGTYRSRDIFPSIRTDCGTFAAEKEVTCSADPSRTVLLGPGTTYDLTVAGPRIPVLSDPTVLSAQVSEVQRQVPDSALDGELPDDPMYDNLRALQQQFSPEALRAFDYEQPPFDPQCDPYRMLMTTAGLQMVHPAEARELLEVPDGVTARDPKLPCDDWYHCEAR